MIFFHSHCICFSQICDQYGKFDKIYQLYDISHEARGKDWNV